MSADSSLGQQLPEPQCTYLATDPAKDAHALHSEHQHYQQEKCPQQLLEQGRQELEHLERKLLLQQQQQLPPQDKEQPWHEQLQQQQQEQQLQEELFQQQHQQQQEQLLQQQQNQQPEVDQQQQQQQQQQPQREQQQQQEQQHQQLELLRQWHQQLHQLQLAQLQKGDSIQPSTEELSSEQVHWLQELYYTEYTQQLQQLYMGQQYAEHWQAWMHENGEAWQVWLQDNGEQYQTWLQENDVLGDSETSQAWLWGQWQAWLQEKGVTGDVDTAEVLQEFTNFLRGKTRDQHAGGKDGNSKRRRRRGQLDRLKGGRPALAPYPPTPAARSRGGADGKAAHQDAADSRPWPPPAHETRPAVAPARTPRFSAWRESWKESQDRARDRRALLSEDKESERTIVERVASALKAPQKSAPKTAEKPAQRPSQPTPGGVYRPLKKKVAPCSDRLGRFNVFKSRSGARLPRVNAAGSLAKVNDTDTDADLQHASLPVNQVSTAPRKEPLQPRARVSTAPRKEPLQPRGSVALSGVRAKPNSRPTPKPSTSPAFKTPDAESVPVPLLAPQHPDVEEDFKHPGLSRVPQPKSRPDPEAMGVQSRKPELVLPRRPKPAPPAAPPPAHLLAKLPEAMRKVLETRASQPSVPEAKDSTSSSDTRSRVLAKCAPGSAAAKAAAFAQAASLCPPPGWRPSSDDIAEGKDGDRDEKLPSVVRAQLPTLAEPKAKQMYAKADVRNIEDPTSNQTTIVGEFGAEQDDITAKLLAALPLDKPEQSQEAACSANHVDAPLQAASHNVDITAKLLDSLPQDPLHKDAMAMHRDDQPGAEQVNSFPNGHLLRAADSAAQPQEGLQLHTFCNLDFTTQVLDALPLAEPQQASANDDITMKLLDALPQAAPQQVCPNSDITTRLLDALPQPPLEQQASYNHEAPLKFMLSSEFHRDAHQQEAYTNEDITARILEALPQEEPQNKGADQNAQEMPVKRDIGAEILDALAQETYQQQSCCNDEVPRGGWQHDPPVDAPGAASQHPAHSDETSAKLPEALPQDEQPTPQSAFTSAAHLQWERPAQSCHSKLHCDAEDWTDHNLELDDGHAVSPWNLLFDNQAPLEEETETNCSTESCPDDGNEQSGLPEKGDDVQQRVHQSSENVADDARNTLNRPSLSRSKSDGDIRRTKKRRSCKRVGTFLVRVDQTEDLDLGLTIGIDRWHEACSSVLIVEHVSQDAAALIPLWNAAHPGTAICRGDIIVDVNGKCGTAEDLRLEIENSQCLRLVVVRPALAGFWEGVWATPAPVPLPPFFQQWWSSRMSKLEPHLPRLIRQRRRQQQRLAPGSGEVAEAPVVKARGSVAAKDPTLALSRAGAVEAAHGKADGSESMFAAADEEHLEELDNTATPGGLWSLLEPGAELGENAAASSATIGPRPRNPEAVGWQAEEERLARRAARMRRLQPKGSVATSFFARAQAEYLAAVKAAQEAQAREAEELELQEATHVLEERLQSMDDAKRKPRSWRQHLAHVGHTSAGGGARPRRAPMAEEAVPDAEILTKGVSQAHEGLEPSSAPIQEEYATEVRVGFDRWPDVSRPRTAIREVAEWDDVSIPLCVKLDVVQQTPEQSNLQSTAPVDTAGVVATAEEQSSTNTSPTAGQQSIAAKPSSEGDACVDAAPVPQPAPAEVVAQEKPTSDKHDAAPLVEKTQAAAPAEKEAAAAAASAPAAAKAPTNNHQAMGTPSLKPDGRVRLRIFDLTTECQGLAMQQRCVVLGSTLRLAHVADGTHKSVKAQHAAIIFRAPDDFLVQAINGDVHMSGASAHPAVTKVLLRERRAAPRETPSEKVLRVGSRPELLTRQRCCFQMGDSRTLFFLDILPSAANVRALGTARHLLHAFVDGRAFLFGKQRRKVAAMGSQSKADDVPEAGGIDADTKAKNFDPVAYVYGSKPEQVVQKSNDPTPFRKVDDPHFVQKATGPRNSLGVRGASPPPDRPLWTRRSPKRSRSPSVWRHDRVQSLSASPGRRQRAPSSESLHQRRSLPAKLAERSRRKKAEKDKKRKSQEQKTKKSRLENVRKSDDKERKRSQDKKFKSRKLQRSEKRPKRDGSRKANLTSDKDIQQACSPSPWRPRLPSQDHELPRPGRDQQSDPGCVRRSESPELDGVPKRHKRDRQRRETFETSANLQPDTACQPEPEQRQHEMSRPLSGAPREEEHGEQYAHPSRCPQSEASRPSDAASRHHSKPSASTTASNKSCHERNHGDPLANRHIDGGGSDCQHPSTSPKRTKTAKKRRHEHWQHDMSRSLNGVPKQDKRGKQHEDASQCPQSDAGEQSDTVCRHRSKSSRSHKALKKSCKRVLMGSDSCDERQHGDASANLQTDGSNPKCRHRSTSPRIEKVAKKRRHEKRKKKRRKNAVVSSQSDGGPQPRFRQRSKSPKLNKKEKKQRRHKHHRRNGVSFPHSDTGQRLDHGGKHRSKTSRSDRVSKKLHGNPRGDELTELDCAKRARKPKSRSASGVVRRQVEKMKEVFDTSDADATALLEVSDQGKQAGMPRCRERKTRSRRRRSATDGVEALHKHLAGRGVSSQPVVPINDVDRVPQISPMSIEANCAKADASERPLLMPAAEPCEPNNAFPILEIAGVLESSEYGSSYETESGDEALSVRVADQVELPPAVFETGEHRTVSAGHSTALSVTPLGPRCLPAPVDQAVTQIADSSESAERDLPSRFQVAGVLPVEETVEPAVGLGGGSSYEYETESEEDRVAEEGIQTSFAGGVGSEFVDVGASRCQGGGLKVQSKLAHTLAAAFQERQRAIGQSVGFNVEAHCPSQDAAHATQQPQVQNVILLE